MKIRITVPWHEQVLVKAQPYGIYRVQFVSRSCDPSDLAAPVAVSIMAVQKPLKENENADEVSESWDMSGYFQTQQDAIYAWENGFEVMPRNQNEAPVIEDTVIYTMLTAGLAAGVEE